MKRTASRMSLWTRRFILLAAALLLAASVSQADDWAPSEYLAHVKFDTSLGVLAVPITVGSKKGVAILDTGTTYTVINAGLRKEVGAPLAEVLSATSNEPVRLQQHESPKIKIAGIERMLDSVCVYDLSLVKAGIGMDVDAIVGMDFLSRLVLFVDNREGNIYFCEQLHLKEALGHQLPLKLMNNNVRSLQIDVSGRSVVAMLDTGNLESLSLESSEFDKLAQEERMDLDCKPVLLFSADNSLSLVPSARGSVGIGALNCDRVYLSRSRQSQIGLRLLSRTRWVADFPNNRLFIRPGAHYSSVDHGDCDGISVTSLYDELLISKLHSGSTAELKGFKAGDVIVDVGGKKVKACDQPTVVRLLKVYREEPLRILVRRADQEMRLELPR